MGVDRGGIEGAGVRYDLIRNVLKLVPKHKRTGVHGVEICSILIDCSLYLRFIA